MKNDGCIGIMTILHDSMDMPVRLSDDLRQIEDANEVLWRIDVTCVVFDICKVIIEKRLYAPYWTKNEKRLDYNFNMTYCKV